MKIAKVRITLSLARLSRCLHYDTLTTTVFPSKLKQTATLILVGLSLVDGSTKHRQLATDIDFAGFNAGDVVTSLDSNTIAVSAMVVPFDGAAMVPGHAVVFGTCHFESLSLRVCVLRD